MKLPLIPLVACIALSMASGGCTSSRSHKSVKTAGSGQDEKAVLQECQRVSNEAVRLRNGAVSAFNSGRRDAALILFDQSIDSLRQITSGAAHCDADAVTAAYEQLDKTMHEREETNRLTR